MLQDRPVLLDHSFGLPTDQPFTLAQATAAGLSKKQVGTLVREAYLRRPLRNVYVAAHVPDTLDLRARMVALVVPPGSFVCDRTAAWLHGAPSAMAPNEHLVVPAVSCFRPSAAGRLRNELTDSGEREVLPRDLMELEGLLVTTPLRTALDLGRLQPSDDLRLAGMDAMLRLGAFSHDELLAEVPRFDRRRGVVGLRALAPRADGGAESFAESALRRRWYAAGLPRPTTQIRVLVDGMEIFRLDLGLEELLFAAEYDGEPWHSGDDQLAQDRQRRDWLSDHRGWMVEVFRRDDVFGPRQSAEQRLAVAFRQARATLGSRTIVH